MLEVLTDKFLFFYSAELSDDFSRVRTTKKPSIKYQLLKFMTELWESNLQNAKFYNCRIKHNMIKENKFFHLFYDA